jgi:hypothetical protein
VSDELLVGGTHIVCVNRMEYKGFSLELMEIIIRLRKELLSHELVSTWIEYKYVFVS